jgi:hypothetical protein
VKRPPPREQALTDGMRSFPDRRGERAVECCLKRKGAYYYDLARRPATRPAAGPGTSVPGLGILVDSRRAPLAVRDGIGR